MMPRARRLTAAAILALLAACSSAPATRFYVLSSTAAAPAAGPTAGRPVALVLKPVALPQYLDRSQIVVRGAGHRLRMSETELWAGDLGQDMTRVLAEDLGRLLRTDRVVVAPHTLQLAPDFRVEVEVLGFELGADGRVRLAARWSLARGADGRLLAGTLEGYAGAPLGATPDYEAVVASMSALCGELAQAIARGIGAQGGRGG